MSTTTDEFEIIYVASYWHKWAKKRIYARSFGLKAFPIRVRTRKLKEKAQYTVAVQFKDLLKRAGISNNLKKLIEPDDIRDSIIKPPFHKSRPS